jgi:carbonic anhydrase
MNTFRSRFAFAVLMTALAQMSVGPVAAAECHYGYEGAEGPEHWWELCAPENYTCEAGTRQSPIDLPAAPLGDLAHLSFHYQLTPLKAENNGHTIEVTVAAGSYLRSGEERYELRQFHFHTPSEHRLQGEEFPMELHFVHRNALGEPAVVGVFLQEGAANPLIQRIWDAVEGEAHALNAPAGSFDPEDLLPANREFYRYAGSLTTPPCTEGVRWHVLHTPIEVSAAQVDEFRALFPLNARPIQPLNERAVLTSH